MFVALLLAAVSFTEIDAIFERFRESRKAPSLIYGVVMDGKLVHTKGWGGATPQTVFRIASMTKSFTALAVLKLRDEGKLSLEDPVAKWIPEFASMKYPTADSAPIRVRDLLTHSAGFPEDNPWGDRQLGVSDEALTAWLKKGIPFSTPPATAYEYSNYGFALAGRIIAKASGVPYREYVERNILTPLGMKSSTLEPSAVPAERRAAGHKRDGKEQEPSLPHGAFGAMGGLLTSAEDLGKYVAFMLSAWPPRDEPDNGPVRRSSLREMQQMWRHSDLTVTGATPDAPLAATAAGYGYGLRIARDCRFPHIVGHGGGLPGFGSWMAWLPDYGVGMLAMANVTYAGPSQPVNEAFDVLRRQGAIKRRVPPPSAVLTSMRDKIFDLWKNWDDKKAAALVADNFFLDVPLAIWHSEMARLKAKFGACTDVTPVEPENLLRGTFRMTCERGPLYGTFTLAPTQPPTIQRLYFLETPLPETNICRP